MAVERCCVPRCPTTSADTCVVWGKRMCYAHVTDWALWSEEHQVVDRAPTGAEWKAFLRSLEMAEQAAGARP